MNDYITDLIAEAAEQSETHIDLGGVGLTAVPDELCNLVSLTHLSLRGNDLEQIPAEIGRLSNLVQLSLASNKLVELPEELGKLTGLKSLNLKDNLLTALPISLLDLSQLERLQLSDNPLGIPADLVAKYDRPQEILAYYREYCVVEPPPPPRPLSQRLAEAFSGNQLDNLIEDLCVPEEEVAAVTPEQRAKLLIDYHERNRLGDEFMALLQLLRPRDF